MSGCVTVEASTSSTEEKLKIKILRSFAKSIPHRNNQFLTRVMLAKIGMTPSLPISNHQVDDLSNT